METPKQILPAIAVIIFNDKGEILLQRRTDTNLWCIICGHVEYGETVANAVLREIKEETGCSAEIKHLIGIYSVPLSQSYHYADRNVHYITSYFEAALTSKIDLGFTNEETAGLKYFPADQLPGDMAQINENWLRDAYDKKGMPFIR